MLLIFYLKFEHGIEWKDWCEYFYLLFNMHLYKFNFRGYKYFSRKSTDATIYSTNTKLDDPYTPCRHNFGKKMRREFFN